MSVSPGSSGRSAVLAAMHLFEPLPPAERDALAAAAHRQSFAAGEDLFQEGAPCRGIYIVASGAVKIVKTTPAGRQVMLALQEAPSTVAEVPVFDGGPYPATVTAVQPTQVFVILKEDFLACCRRNPGLALRFLEVFGRRLRQLVNLVELITFGSVRQRLATALLEFSEAAGRASFALPETQEELASRLGTVREVVSRNLGRFQGEGLIRIQRREIEILDAAGLRTEAETEI
jgi:CRP/FNR family transcriptional regulator